MGVIVTCGQKSNKAEITDFHEICAESPLREEGDEFISGDWYIPRLAVGGLIPRLAAGAFILLR